VTDIDVSLVPREVGVLDPFVAAGLFDPACIHVAATIARACSTNDLATLLGVALAVRAVGVGHVCVELTDVAATVVVDEEEDATGVTDLPWPDPETWVRELMNSPAVALVGSDQNEFVRPLVLSGTRLYLERYWRFEQEVASELTRRAQVDGGFVHASPALNAVLDQLFGPDDPTGRDLQRLAASHALTRPLTVIAGGPGTGKTRTVAAILLAARELARTSDRTVEIALAAPTAKAASRISAALLHELVAPHIASELRISVLDTEATTLHRLLGASGHGSFSHDVANPLVHDIVIVDETSMVSLPLMARLIAAVRPEASLVLVGDPFQITSVEAGAVLGEVTGLNRSVSSQGPLSGDVIRLERIHRFDTDSAIAALAAAIRTGDADGAISLLRAGTEVRWIDSTDEAGLSELSARAVDHATEVIALARSGESDDALQLANDTKILCATRRGPLGVWAWTQRIEAGAAEVLGDLSIGRRWYVGRPLIVTRNDYLNQTVNGDVGLVVSEDRRPVVKLQSGLVLRSFAPSQLGDVETWWAMTIHKSQGSEFRNVVVTLPPPPSPILTRELLYTAVTRARETVTIVSSEAALRAAINRPVSRASGLADLLWST
jgi:exodeoxyribonuclease V alpha subunit